uniref:Mitochondrial inner membrane protease subunit 2 n=1 Tax=Lepisosteus oculatus TaxID=7918 RepID=W5NG32_LEPOC
MSPNWSPKNPQQKIIKRVIALEGDIIKTMGYKNRYLKIPDGHFWIEGDHHGHSLDSNNFGPSNECNKNCDERINRYGISEVFALDWSVELWMTSSGDAELCLKSRTCLLYTFYRCLLDLFMPELPTLYGLLTGGRKSKHVFLPIAHLC